MMLTPALEENLNCPWYAKPKKRKQAYHPVLARKEGRENKAFPLALLSLQDQDFHAFYHRSLLHP